MSVDLPAPFSPIRACTSPGRRVKSTWSSASTPGKRIVMSRISTTGAAVGTASGGVSGSASMGQGILPVGSGAPPERGRRLRRGTRGEGGSVPVRTDQRRIRERSVLPRVDDRGGLFLGERLVGGEVRLLDRRPVEHLLDEVGGGLAEQRVALDDVVDLAVDQRLHAVVDSVDRHDVDVLARLEAGRLDRLDGAEILIVVVRED